MPGRKRSNVLVGDELRRARKEAGVSQEWLAFEARLDRTYISHLENGHKSPTVDVLLRICQALGVAASVLLARVERSLESRRK
jgi:transcriptional regulator with XRE-family HTH domain